MSEAFVAVCMGADFDLPRMRAALDVLRDSDISSEVKDARLQKGLRAEI